MPDDLFGPAPKPAPAFHPSVLPLSQTEVAALKEKYFARPIDLGSPIVIVQMREDIARLIRTIEGKP